MQNRIIKFRAWDIKRKELFFPSQLSTYTDSNDGPLKTIRFQGDYTSNSILMQFTGLLDKQGKEIYEGDIFRVEEDSEDLIYYLVVVWVQEWCMFCTLNMGEYKRYLIEGVTSLDEPMFWTYTLEDTNDRRFYLCGNVFEHRHLIEPGY